MFWEIWEKYINFLENLMKLVMILRYLDVIYLKVYVIMQKFHKYWHNLTIIKILRSNFIVFRKCWKTQNKFVIL